jgi:hypothetical protein
MNAPWRIDLLGWLRAVQGDRVIRHFRMQKTGALLAYLSFNCHRSHRRQELIELLWPEIDPAAGRHNLRQSLFSLRRQLEPPGVPQGAVILADRATVQLNPTVCLTDVAEFEAACRAALPGVREKSGERVEPGRDGEGVLFQRLSHDRGQVLSPPTTSERMRHLEAAIRLYRGELLPGYSEEWILPRAPAARGALPSGA